MAEHQPPSKQSCTQSDSLWRTEYTASTKAFGSNTVTVFKFIPSGTTHISVLCIPIITFFMKAFTRTDTSAHWQKQPKQLPNIFEGTEGKPSQVHSSCVHLDPLQGIRQTVTGEDPCISSSSSLTSPTFSCYSYYTAVSWGVTTLKQISQKTNLLDKTCSPVLEMEKLKQHNPPGNHLQPLPAKVMKHCWQGQRTLNPP